MGQDLLLVTRKAMSIRFTADDTALRPMGRATEALFPKPCRSWRRLPETSGQAFPPK